MSSIAHDVLLNAQELKAALSDGDRFMLRFENQELAVSMLHTLGNALVHALDVQLPDFEIRLIARAGRHAGNKFLGQVGEDLRRRLDNWPSDMTSDADYAQAYACGLVDEFLAHWYVQTALEAYLAAAPSDDCDREVLERELGDFKTVAKVFEDGVKGHENGIRAMTWAAKNTHYVTNHRAMLPEGVAPPWYLDMSWYENYGIS